MYKIYKIMRTASYHHNGFLTIDALEYMIYGKFLVVCTVNCCYK